MQVNGEWSLMAPKKNSQVLTKTDYPEFFEILEKRLDGIKVPEIIIKETQTLHTAQAAHISYSICFNRRYFDKLTLLEKVAVTLHETGHFNSPIHRFHVYCWLVGILVLILFSNLFLPFSIFSPLYNVISICISKLALPAALNFALCFLFALLFYTRILFSPILCISVWDEFKADKFATQRIDKKHLINALNKMEKPPRLTYWFLYLLFWPFHTHPSNKKRIARLLKDCERIGIDNGWILRIKF